MNRENLDDRPAGRVEPSFRRGRLPLGDKNPSAHKTDIYPEVAEDSRYGDVALVREWSGGRKYCAVIRWDQVPGLIADLQGLLDERP